MTEEVIPYTPSNSCIETPYQMLARLTREADQLEEEQNELNRRIKQNAAERMMVAKKIYTDGITDENLTLDLTFKMRENTKVNYEIFQKEFPAIWERAHPYVSDNVAMDIIETIHGGDMDAVQALLRNMAPEVFAEKAKVRIETLRKCLSKEEKAQLEQAGVLTTEFTPTGEPRVMAKSFANAVRNQRKPKPLKAVEEEDD